MIETGSPQPELNFEIPENAPRPTGDPWLVSRTKPASVPVPLPVVMVRVEGSYTALDRKLWLLLLHNAWDNLDKSGHIHEASVGDVLRLFRQFGRRDLGARGALETSTWVCAASTRSRSTKFWKAM